jgi:hypothetical protein
MGTSDHHLDRGRSPATRAALITSVLLIVLGANRAPALAASVDVNTLVAVVDPRPVRSKSDASLDMDLLGYAAHYGRVVRHAVAKLAGWEPVAESRIKKILGFTYRVSVFQCQEEPGCVQKRMLPLRKVPVTRVIVGRFVHGRQKKIFLALRLIDLSTGKKISEVAGGLRMSPANALDEDLQALVADLLDPTQSESTRSAGPSEPAAEDGQPVKLAITDPRPMRDKSSRRTDLRFLEHAPQLRKILVTGVEALDRFEVLADSRLREMLGFTYRVQLFKCREQPGCVARRLKRLEKNGVRLGLVSSFALVHDRRIFLAVHLIDLKTSRVIRSAATESSRQPTELAAALGRLASELLTGTGIP